MFYTEIDGKKGGVLKGMFEFIGNAPIQKTRVLSTDIH